MDYYQPQLNFGNKWIAPGVYDMENEEYHSSVGISRSGIMEFLKTPYHFYDKYNNQRERFEYCGDENEEEPGKSLMIGNAVHTYLLEKKEFFNRYSLDFNVEKRSKEGKELYALLQSESAGKTKLSSKDYYLIKNIAESVEKHEHAPKLIANSIYEKSIYWVDKDTQLLCKVRPDIWNKKYIADIKTTACGSENAFKNAVPKYGYHIQAAMIFDGIKEATGEEHTSFIFIAVEKKRPFAVAIYELSEEAINVGRFIYKQALMSIRDFMDKNTWPSYEYQIINLPSWAYKV